MVSDEVVCTTVRTTSSPHLIARAVRRVGVLWIHREDHGAARHNELWTGKVTGVHHANRRLHHELGQHVG
jgi:hypothetical protein